MQPLSLLRGRLLQEHPALPLTLAVRLDDLRPRFLSKCRVGSGWRAIARNGRVLLASDRPLKDLIGPELRLRIQVWHRTILTGDPPEPYGLLLSIRGSIDRGEGPTVAARLITGPADSADLALDVGGGQALAFFASAGSRHGDLHADCGTPSPRIEVARCPARLEAPARL